MSKPQMASEPSMEEILASIRKMIADDRPGPSPMPDTMGRTPFGDMRQASAPDTGNLNGTDPQTPARTSNSLSDALKVATALSDQRRSLQQDLSTVSDKAPRNNLEALTELTSSRSEIARSGSSTELRNVRPTAEVPLPFGLRDEETAGAPQPSELKADLLSFDFGTLVPQRNEGQNQPKPQSADSKPISLQTTPSSSPTATSPSPTAAQPGSEVETGPAIEPRVLPLRTGTTGFNGSGPNVAPFPRTTRETAKPGASAPASPETVEAPQPQAKSETLNKAETPAKAETVHKPDSPVETPTATKPGATAPEAQPKPKAMSATLPAPSGSKPVTSKPLVAEPLAAASEALLDAVVDLVQQQPGALSVFASGASFISGVSEKKEQGGQTLPVLAQKHEIASDDAPAQPAKLDRAAAELLRPMLRQWLAENMERILEDALRSELTAQIESGKGPGKS
ncbi:DUF2497 domain-containing protein [Hyphomicrobium sp. 1Nfss2.1]|uniref:hypothetical protein n=1 Tax=Hyphomicrobium sp. 1Nfss2.1 TaxID=3413936 RepID=UPI003C7AB5FB